MGTRSTNNSMQTAPLHRIGGEESGSGAGTPLNRGSLDKSPLTSHAEVPVGDEGVSSALAALIAQTVQAALAAERSGQLAPQVPINQPSPSLAEATNPSVPTANLTSSCSGVRRSVVLHRPRQLKHPSLQDHPHESSFVSCGIRGIARPRSHSAGTLTGAVFAQALTG